MEKFLITNNVNATYDKIFKIIDSHYGASARRCSDAEQQLPNGFMVGFIGIPKYVSDQIKALKYVEVIG